jgi:hypothetical protein
MRTTARFSSRSAAGAALSLLLAASHAHGRAAGLVAEGCTGCHNGGAVPGITVQASPANPALGETVTLNVTIQAVNGAVGGLYLRTDGRGRLVAVDGQGTVALDDSQLVHNTPRRASDGAVRFAVRWIAPETPGGVVIKVWGVSGNGDNRSRGDGASSAELSFAYGCPGTTYYSDRDQDGYGYSGTVRVDCSRPDDYSERDGDCDDNDPNIRPDRGEDCNGRDDDCDGQVDEDLEVAVHHRDSDGDGHGSPGGDTVMAICPPPGYAPNQDDCDDNNPEVHGGATETCNYLDDDCDGSVDERVREVCGVGMCAREAQACGDPSSCTPGEPRPEACNYLDDDCDGEIDEGDALCGAGFACRDGECLPDDGGGAGGRGDEGTDCAVDPRGASPWGLLALLSPLAVASPLRRWRRPRLSRGRSCGSGGGSGGAERRRCRRR